MTAPFQDSAHRRTGLWDSAAGGVFPGLLGGIAMLVLLAVAGYLAGHTPGQVLSAFDTAGSMPLRGALIHLAVSCVYGALFALLIHLLPARLRPTWSTPLLGLLYGLLLWLLAVTLLRQAAVSLLAAVPAAFFLLAHLAYGLVLGLWAAK